MEVTTATKLENGRWLFEWTADSGDPFDVYLDGELLDSIVGDSYETGDLDGYVTAPPPLEIVSDESGVYADSLLYPPFAILQWRGVTGAEAYLVEWYTGGNWIQYKTIMAVAATGYYAYQTDVLAGCVATSFRVTALDALGNGGAAVTFTFYVVPNPPPPEVEFTVVAGEITVDES